MYKAFRTYPLRQIFWELTLRCNLHCLHCGSECRKFADIEDMPLKDFLPVLKEVRMRQPDVKCIVVTAGGEPLVRPDILRCGREICRNGFYWGMVSNGLMIDAPMMKALSRNGLAALSVDIDGLRSEHNWLRQSDVSFDKVYDSLRYIREAPHLVWDVITCVNRRNFSSLEELKRMLIEAGVRQWRVFTIVPMGRAVGNPQLHLDKEEFKGLMDFIVATRNEGKIRMSYSCEGYLGDYEMKVRDHAFFCQAGFNTASIRVNGDISGCLSVRSKYDQGNIYRASFWDVWSNRFGEYRCQDWKKKGICLGCDVFDKCRGNGMHLRRDDGSLMMCYYNRLK